MPNSNPQAIRVSNEKIRPGSDRFAQLYNLVKSYEAQATAENWLSLFPNDLDTIDDGSDVDGRAIITNTDVRDFISMMQTFLTYMEQNAFANRNLVFKIAVNPEQNL